MKTEVDFGKLKKIILEEELKTITNLRVESGSLFVGNQNDIINEFKKINSIGDIVDYYIQYNHMNPISAFEIVFDKIHSYLNN
jgi:hypothetical protein